MGADRYITFCEQWLEKCLDAPRVLLTPSGTAALEMTALLMDIQPGDVPATYADVSALAAWTGFQPATSIDEGVGRFVAWYRDYYRV